MNHETSSGIWTTCLKLLLRFGASVMGLALLAVFMPTEWMALANGALGLEPFPATPLTQYLTRSLSLLYATYGSLMWVTSSDVRRFAPVITYMAVADIVFALFILVIDMAAGLPPWWAFGEAGATLGMGAMILFLQRRVGLEARSLEAHSLEDSAPAGGS
ncbi:MAG: hypothetical protein K0U98_03775 [Deltaproteobacteria bacterium]|nr:hypothetical protein [Deltaproteobacteria bacterium]